MITRLLLIGALCLSVVPAATADDSAQANRLFVEAVKLLEEAATEAEMDKVSVLQGALDKLNEIIEDHPSSDAAVKLIAGQPIGFVVISDLQEQVVKAQLAVGDVEAAVATAKQMSAMRGPMGLVPRDKALALIVETQIKTGDLDGATATTNLAITERIRTRLLQQIPGQ